MKRPTRRQVVLAAVLALGTWISIAINSDDDDPAPPAPVPSAPVAAVVAPVVQSPLDRLKKSAEAGNVKDQLQLAVKYSTATGAARDQGEASRWYLMAAQAGDPQAMYEMSIRFRNGHGLTKSDADADVWRQRAASAGIAQAQYEMAHLYGTVSNKGAVISQLKGNDPGDSSRHLVMLLTRAAESGSASAAHELALVRLFGISRGGANKAGYLVPLPSVTASAVQLLTETAEAGHWQSQHTLAELYQVGFADIKANQAESNKWWQRLEAQTDAAVQASIGGRYLVTDASQYAAGENKWKGKNLSHEESNQVAFEWLNRAGAQGHASSLWQIATMKYNGVGTSKDFPGAIEHHRKAAELGHVDAMYYFGVIHADGNTVPQNYAASLQWLNKAAGHEDPYGSNLIRARAQNALGALYENGHGVGRDLLIAYAFYNLAAAGGDEKAKESASRVAGQLKPEQLLEGQSLARDWKPGTQIVRRSGNSAS